MGSKILRFLPCITNYRHQCFNFIYLKNRENMKYVKYIIIAILVMIIYSYFSTEKDLKKYLKCGIAAEQLERYSASDKISKKMAEYLTKNKIEGSARHANKIASEVREDLKMNNNANLQRQIYTLVKAYNSSKCRKLHGEEKIKMPFDYYLYYIFL